MEKLDRQVWAVGVSFRAYGLRIGIRANSDLALLSLVKKLVPVRKWSDVPTVDMLYSVIAGDQDQGKRFRRYSVAYANSTELARSADFQGVLDAVENHLSLYLAEFAKSRVFIHAGVVGWNGKAVVMPGRSYSGKSTLVTALLRAGATYYSDEFAAVDRFGRVYPYPRPIQLRNGDGSTHRIQPADVPAKVGRKGLPVELILLTHHQKGVVWRPREVSPAEGLLTLLTNTVSAQRNPARALRTLKTMMIPARRLKGPRGEADATVARLLRSGQLPA